MTKKDIETLKEIIKLNSYIEELMGESFFGIENSKELKRLKAQRNYRIKKLKDKGIFEKLQKLHITSFKPKKTMNMPMVKKGDEIFISLRKEEKYD